MEVDAGKRQSGETASVFVTPQLFDRIVSSQRNLIAIESARGDDILAQFRHFAVRSGNSIYAWNETGGIGSLRERDVTVPGSARLPDAFRHILASFHFGVYLFVRLGGALRFSPARNQVLAQLRQIGRAKATASARKVVLIDTRVTLSEGVDELMERMPDESTGPRRLRLRDGRWLT